jgi:glutamate synthase domain-containing protein 2
MPLRDGLLFVHGALTSGGLRDEIRVIAAGKVSAGFRMVRAIALGANLCSSARSMMFALGCTQARCCSDKAERVAPLPAPPFWSCSLPMG